MIKMLEEKEGLAKAVATLTAQKEKLEGLCRDADGEEGGGDGRRRQGKRRVARVNDEDG